MPEVPAWIHWVWPCGTGTKHLDIGPSDVVRQSLVKISSRLVVWVCCCSLLDNLFSSLVSSTFDQQHHHHSYVRTPYSSSFSPQSCALQLQYRKPRPSSLILLPQLQRDLLEPSAPLESPLLDARRKSETHPISHQYTPHYHPAYYKYHNGLAQLHQSWRPRPRVVLRMAVKVSTSLGRSSSSRTG